MPRQSRIDFPGALHHVIIRGINRAEIFRDNHDRTRFVTLLQKGLEKTDLDCYAWALIPNHVHLLLRTSGNPLTQLMRSMLTGYAVYFNRRHKRTGYLFQNRYKSILCDEEAYLLQLVRYIHLNPLRSGLVRDMHTLSVYPWSGHAVLVGKRDVPWQNVDAILRRFGKTVSKARHNYSLFVRRGIAEGQRSDLTGGGLIRSAGGWQGLRELRKGGERWRGDERILGDGNFVEKALQVAQENLSRKTSHKAAGWTLDILSKNVAELFRLEPGDLKNGKRYTVLSRARSIFCRWATFELGYKLTEVADYLNVTKEAVFYGSRKGEEIIQKNHIKFPEVI